MSLINEQTGKAATPLTELANRSEEMKRMTENQLLKEALAISNENCKNLIETQNMLVEDLTAQVKRLRQDNEIYSDRTSYEIDRYNREMAEVVAQERQFKNQIASEVKDVVITEANRIGEYAKRKIDETVSETNKQIKTIVSEMDAVKENMKIRNVFQKIFFWATPILLLGQIILTIYIIILTFALILVIMMWR